MSRCWNHPERPASHVCKECWEQFCDSCYSSEDGLCSKCLELDIGINVKPKRSDKWKIPLSAYILVSLLAIVMTLTFVFYPPPKPIFRKPARKEVRKTGTSTVTKEKITVKAQSRNTAKEILRKALYYREYLHGSFGITDEFKRLKINIYVFEDVEEYAKETGKPTWSEGYADPESGRIYIVADFQENSVLAHEMSHLLFDKYVNYETSHTAWINEGLAVLEQMKVDSTVKQNMRESLAAIKEGDFTPIKTLGKVNVADEITKEEINNWYSQCASVVYYIKLNYGKNKFKKLLISLKNRVTFEKAMEEIYNISDFTTLQNKWFNDLNKRNYFE